jgi:predicted RNA-binding Zn-ribbon protein involved in translation (DUF1610 family)
MSETTVAAGDVLRRLDELGAVTEADVGTTAYADLESQLNLNAAAIGLGLEEVAYEPERFPGLVYHPEDGAEAVAAVLGNGTVFVACEESVGAHDVVDEVTESLVELGLLADPGPAATFSLSPTEVPVPPEYESGETGSAEPDAEDATGSTATTAADESAPNDGGTEIECDNCGHGLTGEENFCPECGEELQARCRACGFELSGGENFYPECGTNVAAD